MSGRKSYKRLREEIRANPERLRRIEALGQVYDTTLALAEMGKVPSTYDQAILEPEWDVFV